ncbi:MAG: alpha-L-fucosidase [Bacteroidota bacterium]|nr:alpha-L-fucosidase [Bacteroidota bacterium]
MRKNALVISLLTLFFSYNTIAQEKYPSPIRSGNEPVAQGKFEANWQSLSQYKVPEWFRNAKFGIWAHWGPQCQAEQGDWYARGMYEEGSGYYKYQVAHYGHPSKAGFKEVIHDWKAENWDPEKLVQLYKRTGAQYFFAMANHHDNLDLWDSKYQEWNSVRVGPKKDIVTGWAKAAKKCGLPFGLSVHASHAWTFYEPSQKSDTTGQFAGIPYDGKLTKADGKGTWWEGMDPQALYAQNHKLSTTWGWEWQNGVTIPSQDYCDKFYNRTMDLINKYNPDLLYFDDTALPLYPVSDAGLKIAAHYYNHNMATHYGKLEAVMFGKILTDEQKKCMVWDVERGAPDRGQDLAWQTCTCIGDWHYNRNVYDQNRYKSAATVIRTLIDIVSKNGNLLLNIPVRGDGTIDDKEVTVLEGIAKWMESNKESIFDTRPWKVFGEGLSVESLNPMKEQGFNEGKVKLTAKDIRFVQKDKVIYATLLGLPSEDIIIKSLGKNNGDIKRIELLGSKEKLKWSQENEKLSIKNPNTVPNDIALVFKIFLK